MGSAVRRGGVAQGEGLRWSRKLEWVVGLPSIDAGNRKKRSPGQMSQGFGGGGRNQRLLVAALTA